MKSWPTFKSTKNCFHVFFLDVRFCFFGTLHLRANYMEEDFKKMMRFCFVCVFLLGPAASFETKSIHIALPFLECSRLDSVGVPVSTTASQRLTPNLTATTGPPTPRQDLATKNAKITIEPCGFWICLTKQGSKLDLQTTSFEIP